MFIMTEMSRTGRFTPKEEEIDYENDPSYAHYGLKQGTVNPYSHKLEGETFRSAIQVRVQNIDFVRKFCDILKLRMTGLEFLSLVKQWKSIQNHCKDNNGNFSPQYDSHDGKFTIKYDGNKIGNKYYNIFCMTQRER